MSGLRKDSPSEESTDTAAGMVLSAPGELLSLGAMPPAATTARGRFVCPDSLRHAAARTVCHRTCCRNRPSVERHFDREQHTVSALLSVRREAVLDQAERLRPEFLVEPDLRIKRDCLAVLNPCRSSVGLRRHRVGMFVVAGHG